MIGQILRKRFLRRRERGSRRPSWLVAGALGCFALVSCSADSGQSEPDAIVAHASGVSSPSSLAEVVSSADFVAIVEVTSSRQPTVDDIEPPEPGVTPVSVRPEEFRTGRILTYAVRDVVWSNSDAKIPSEFEVVAMGYHDTGEELVPIAPADGVRAEEGSRYLAPIFEYADDMYALAGFGMQYPIDSKSGEVDTTKLTPKGPPEFVELSLDELGVALASTAPVVQPSPPTAGPPDPSPTVPEESGNTVP